MHGTVHTEMLYCCADAGNKKRMKMPGSSDHSDDEYVADDSGQDLIPIDVTV